MLLKPACLKHHVAAATRGRYALNSIALTEDGVLSTDGHALLFTPHVDDDPGDAPKIEGVDAKSPGPAADCFLLALDDAAKVAGLVGRGRKHTPPITQLIQAEINGDSIACGATDLSTNQVLRVQRMEGAYPVVGRVIPDYSGAVTITLNIDQLLRSVKALRGVTDADVVTLRVLDDQQAVGLSCKDGTAMLVMPVQVDRPEDHIPDRLARLRFGNDGPPVAAPANPEEEDEDEPEFNVPTEVEMEDAQQVHDELPTIPEPAPQCELPPRRRRRRKLPANAQDELQEILSGV